MCYINQPVTLTELEDLAKHAVEEEEAFFKRNPHLVEPYRQRLILVALCQGAALQFLGCGYGVKDFDIHFFYAKNPDKPRLARTVKQFWADVGDFPNAQIDFIRTVVPNAQPHLKPDDAIQTVQEFLLLKPTSNACHLSKKAVIGLYPNELFEKRIWPPDPGRLCRAQGCLLGQLAGDALGSLVEFQSAEEIRQKYPNGVRDLADGGTHNTIAGQPTDDSEMALMLARTLICQGRFDSEAVSNAYHSWLDSEPFDCGYTVYSGLNGDHDPSSQANGALMRISPLGIFGANPSYDLAQVSEWARLDALLTHIHPVCQQANALFAMAIAHVIRTGCPPYALYCQIATWAKDMHMEPALHQVIEEARNAPPVAFDRANKGWVLIAFQNALWQLLHAPNLEEGVVDTVMRGGDTDTNAAICGALLGAVYGRNAVPARWTETVLNCRPQEGQPGVCQPRPKSLWPVDALKLAERLLSPDV